MRLLMGALFALLLSGCGLILDLDPPPEPNMIDPMVQRPADAGISADAEIALGEAGTEDAGMDASMSRDAGMMDAGNATDAGDASLPDGSLDADVDAGYDGGSPDAGPPRILVYRYERIDRPDVDVRSVWISEDGAPWRSVACMGGIREGFGTWECTHDVQPLPVGQHLRFYFDFGFAGTASSCGPTGCGGTHILRLDGRDLAVSEETATDTPANPGLPLRVKSIITP